MSTGRGVAAIGGVCQLIAYVIASFHPPFYGLVLAYVLVGLGAGCKNATWNSFISSLDAQHGMHHHHEDDAKSLGRIDPVDAFRRTRHPLVLPVPVRRRLRQTAEGRFNFRIANFNQLRGTCRRARGFSPAAGFWPRRYRHLGRA